MLSDITASAQDSLGVMCSCFVERERNKTLPNSCSACRIKRIKAMFVPLVRQTLSQTQGDLLASSLQQELYTEDVHKKIYNLIST